MDPITLLTMLDEQDESFRSIYPKYKPIFEAEVSISIILFPNVASS